MAEENGANPTSAAARPTFLRHVMTLATGTTLAQVLTLAAGPILTRLYSPEEFGAFAIYVSLSGILSIIATCRYDLSIPLPDKHEDAINLLGMSVFLSITVSVVSFLLLAVGGGFLARSIGLGSDSQILILVPLSILMLSVQSAASYWCNRRGWYGTIALGSVIQSLVTIVVTIACAVGFRIRHGLVVGALAGQTLACGVMCIGLIRSDRSLLGAIGFRSMIAQARRYLKFPMFNLPYSSLVFFSSRFILFALTSYQHVRAAGLLNYSRTILMAPGSLSSSSVGRVFFERAVASWGTPALRDLTFAILRIMIGLGAPVFVFFVAWGPEIFALVFGEKWREAGVYGRIFAPAGLCILVADWIERVFEVAGRQSASLLLQVVSDLIGIAAVWTTLALGYSPMDCVVVYSLWTCAYHLAYLTLAFRVAQLGTAPLLRMLAAGFGFSLALAGLFFGIRKMLPESRLQLTVGAGALGLIYLLLIPWVRPLLKPLQRPA